MKKVLLIAATLVIGFTAVAQPQGRPEGFPGGRPPRGEGQFNGPRNADMEEFLEQQNEKRDKKYSKILTPEQYQLWKTVETQREFRRLVE